VNFEEISGFGEFFSSSASFSGKKIISCAAIG
jgi:hypothetical protein